VVLFDVSTITGCEVTFSNSTVGAVRYEWDFGDVTAVVPTTSKAGQTHTYASSGDWRVRLSAWNSAGVKDFDELSVSVTCP
jgi:PKD repeat protein